MEAGRQISIVESHASEMSPPSSSQRCFARTKLSEFKHHIHHKTMTPTYASGSQHPTPSPEHGSAWPRPESLALVHMESTLTQAPRTNIVEWVRVIRLSQEDYLNIHFNFCEPVAAYTEHFTFL